MSDLFRFARSPGFVITCGCLIALITFGVRTSFGLFTEPLSLARGWGREVFALSLALQNLLWGVAQPLAGAVVDRMGAGRVLVWGGLLYAGGVALTALATEPAAMHLTAGVMVGLGLGGASFIVVLSAFARLVPEEKRGWALGLATATGSLGQFVVVPLGGGFIELYGWQTALLLLAGLVSVVPVLAGALRAPPGAPEIAAPPPTGDALRQAFGHGSYLLLTAGFFVCGFHVAFITVHLPPYLTDAGTGTQLAAWSIGVIGLFNVVGSYLGGLASGRWPKRWLLSSIYLARAGVITLFLLVPISPESVLLFSAAIGLLWLSTVPATSALVAVMFGTRSLGMLFGFVFFSHQVGAFAGVWLGGAIFAQYGSYAPMWWLAVILGLASAALHLPIRERAVAALP